MKVKIFYPNDAGNIEFTKHDLEELLEEVYNEGYSQGSSKYQKIVSDNVSLIRDKMQINAIEKARNLEGQISFYDLEHK